ncbi:hypothetical protein ACFW0H_28075 [Pseudomonas sp. CR3202]|uniref:hypothetical protein n=1 Tax=Pseudomonas sp. CR3202 TaxID=3351532 RepID=UPI003BF1D346
MADESEYSRLLHEVRQSPIFRGVQAVQWFGVVMFLMAVGLAVFSEITATHGGVTLIVAFGILGLLSLVSARFILSLYLLSYSKKAGKGHARS